MMCVYVVWTEKKHTCLDFAFHSAGFIREPARYIISYKILFVSRLPYHIESRAKGTTRSTQNDSPNVWILPYVGGCSGHGFKHGQIHGIELVGSIQRHVTNSKCIDFGFHSSVFR
jgi:hypothetical protein